MRTNAVIYTTADVKQAERFIGTCKPAPSVMQKTICFIEKGDWDKEIIRHEKKLNFFCGLVIAVAVAYFLPVFFSILVK